VSVVIVAENEWVSVVTVAEKEWVSVVTVAENELVSVVTVAENEWVPVSPKKDEPPAAAVAMKVAETRLQVEMVNQVFSSAMFTEVSEMPAGN
jgi:hypothetical protein